MMQWVMAATLVCGLSVFSACTNEDNTITPDTTKKELLYQWIADYAEVDDVDDGVTYDRVVKVYEFFDDGTGYYERYLLNDGELEFVEYARGENGDFTYTISNHKVTITLLDEFDELEPIRTLTFIGNTLIDPDGKAFRHSTEAEREQVMAWYSEWHGGSAEGTIDLSTVKEDIIAANGSTLTGKLTEVHKISIAPGATVTLQDVEINKDAKDMKGSHAGITCMGSATIILSGTNYVCGLDPLFTSIEVPENRTLVIKGDGTLEVRSYGLASGLLGSSYRNAGNLEIQSGTIKAYGYVFSSGIGAGMIYNCGNITISGGTVIAEGGKSSVGIGGSGDLAGAGRCGDITITGGTVVAKGGSDSPAIGSKTFPCGNITISGGNVTAKGGENAAGIGSCGAGCGDINITGGDVYAAGGQYAAGIGSGYSRSGIYRIYKSINISGGIVLAYGGEDGAGIGTGAKSPQGTHFDSGTINITGGDIEAHGSGKGAGIGAGKDNKCGAINVNINSGNTLKFYTEGYFDYENYDYEHWAGGVGSCDPSNCGTLNIGLGVAVSYCVGKKTPYTEEKFIYLKLADDRAGIVHKQGGVRFETCPHFEYEDYPELCMYCTHM